MIILHLNLLTGTLDMKKSSSTLGKKHTLEQGTISLTLFSYISQHISQQNMTG